MLLYGGTVAVWNELSELRRNIGTASYQVGEELEARSLFPPFCRALHVLPQDNIKKYSRLILLSPSIYHYKGKVPKEYLTVSELMNTSSYAPDAPLENCYKIPLWDPPQH